MTRHFASGNFQGPPNGTYRVRAPEGGRATRASLRGGSAANV
jgi:hypothetical protein